MDVRLLGPLEVLVEGTPLRLGSPRQRGLLARLALDANRVVAVERLVDDLWGEDVPASAVKMVHVYVSQLRKLLPDGTLRTHASGYSLALPDGALDLDRFQRAAEDGRAALAAGDPEAAAERLGRALALWRGRALDEFHEPFAQGEAARLEELRLSALEDRIDADLARGRHAEVGADLEGLIAREPLRERLRGQHMLALYRAGRQAAALDAYHDARRVLDEQLGIQPSPALRELERRVLRQDPELALPSGVSVPRTRYAANGDVSLAYQVYGSGELDLLLVTGWVLPIELFWEEPALARFLERLGSFARVILWDKRGTGMSDRMAPGQLPTLEERMEDLTIVLDAVGVRRPAIFGISEGVTLATLFAATHPERTRALALYGGWARALEAPDHPWGLSRERYGSFMDRIGGAWGETGELLRLWAPSVQDDPRLREWWTRALRVGASPTTAMAWLRISADVDVRDALPSVGVPTLVLHRTGDRMIPVDHGRDLGERIPGAEYLELPGEDHLWWVGEQEDVLRPVERFLTGAPAAPVSERVLATVLWTDGSEDLVRRHGGRVIAGPDGAVLARFDGPTRAIRCAAAIGERRSGIHVGECIRVGDDLRGMAVDVATRIGALAQPGQVVVSRTVADLVAGSDISFEPLAGGLDELSLLAVAQTSVNTPDGSGVGVA